MSGLGAPWAGAVWNERVPPPGPGAVLLPCAARGHCQPRLSAAGSPPPAAPHRPLLPAGIFIALLLRFDIR